MPSKNGFRLNDEECLLPTFPGSRQKNPEETVESSKSRVWMKSVQDGKLLAKGEVLESQFRTEPKGSRNQRKDAQNQQDHGRVVSGLEVWRVNYFKADGVMAKDNSPSHDADSDDVLLFFLFSAELPPYFAAVFVRPCACSQ